MDQNTVTRHDITNTLKSRAHAHEQATECIVDKSIFSNSSLTGLCIESPPCLPLSSTEFWQGSGRSCGPFPSFPNHFSTKFQNCSLPRPHLELSSSSSSLMMKLSSPSLPRTNSTPSAPQSDFLSTQDTLSLFLRQRPPWTSLFANTSAPPIYSRVTFEQQQHRHGTDPLFCQAVHSCENHHSTQGPTTTVPRGRWHLSSSPNTPAKEINERCAALAWARASISSAEDPDSWSTTLDASPSRTWRPPVELRPPREYHRTIRPEPCCHLRPPGVHRCICRDGCCFWHNQHLPPLDVFWRQHFTPAARPSPSHHSRPR
jgi:hypothetical protein